MRRQWLTNDSTPHEYVKERKRSVVSWEGLFRRRETESKLTARVDAVRHADELAAAFESDAGGRCVREWESFRRGREFGADPPGADDTEAGVRKR